MIATEFSHIHCKNILLIFAAANCNKQLDFFFIYYISIVKIINYKMDTEKKYKI